MATKYEYLPLKLGTDNIRLLTLQPGKAADGISITLQHCSLAAATGRYEALSYVWGSTDNPVRIKARSNLLSAYRSLSVTQNLAVALRHLRGPGVPRTLWIDAICIDQNNTQERSKQVLRMNDIYRMAARVVIWLGPESPDSDVAMRLLDHLSRMVRHDVWISTMMPSLIGEAEPHWADSRVSLPWVWSEMRAIEGLINRRWFERLWVVQEALANTATLVVCGTSEMTWKALFHSLLVLSQKPGWSEEMGWRILSIIRAFFPEGGDNPIDMVRGTRQMDCADPRDKIYAVLAVANNALSIEPDYTLNAMQVYQQFAVAHARSYDLDFLRCCELAHQESSWPTWVPDWASPSNTQNTLFQDPTEFAWAPVVEALDQGLIRVPAVRVSALDKVEKISMPSNNISCISLEIRRLAPAHMESLVYKTGCSLLEAFCGALAAVDFREVWLPTRRSEWPNSETGAKAVRACLQHTEETPLNFNDEDGYLNWVYNMTNNRALIFTDEGHIGLALACVRKGDVVYAIPMCASLIVLRPVEGFETRFQVVGECFLYGLNHGEAILGALPGHIRQEWHHKPEINYWQKTYRNVETDEISREDPRLLALGIRPRIGTNGRIRRIAREKLEKAGARIPYIELV
ncbi:hypothetical protein VPNG_03703 [Cytospora leucostoma]|uniref:Heterokaryon incompatibility domain-containing protein n=1 Tax=Cytospora leucostoma TaxID=1230097 RepID=A0A423XEV6_9PEZI|nr:hypothetical protein VPNG_03703 [Cytospora leucostoma]